MFTEYKRSKINSDETQELARSIVATFTKLLIEEEFCTRQLQKLEKGLEYIALLQGRNKKNELTSNLKTLDDERDELTEGIEAMVKSSLHLKQFAPEKGEAAEKLTTLFQITPIDIRASYVTQTNQTIARIQQLQNEDHKALLTALDLLPLFERLVSIQAEFEKVQQEKDALESLKVRGNVRKEVETIKRIIDFILSYLEIQAEDIPEKYEATAKEVAEAVQRVMTTATSRETRKKSSCVKAG